MEDLLNSLVYTINSPRLRSNLTIDGQSLAVVFSNVRSHAKMGSWKQVRFFPADSGDQGTVGQKKTGQSKGESPATHLEGYFASRGSIYCAYKLCPTKVVHVLLQRLQKKQKKLGFRLGKESVSFSCVG